MEIFGPGSVEPEYRDWQPPANARELVEEKRQLIGRYEEPQGDTPEEHSDFPSRLAKNLLAYNHTFPKQYVNSVATALVNNVQNTNLKAEAQRAYMRTVLRAAKQRAYDHAALAIQDLSGLSYFRENPEAIRMAKEEAYMHASSLDGPELRHDVPPTLQYAVDNSLPELGQVDNYYGRGQHGVFDDMVAFGRDRLVSIQPRIAAARKHNKVYFDDGDAAYYKFLQNPMALDDDQWQYPYPRLYTDVSHARTEAAIAAKKLPKARLRKAVRTWQMRTNLPRLKKDIEQDATLRNISTRRAWLDWSLHEEDLDTLPMLKYITGKGSINAAIKSVGLGWRPKGWSRPKGWGVKGVPRPGSIGGSKKSIFGPSRVR